MPPTPSYKKEQPGHKKMMESSLLYDFMKKNYLFKAAVSRGKSFQ